MATATVLGLAYDSPISEFPVRTGPGTTFAKADFKIAKGTAGLEILDVQPDAQGTCSDFGRVYQWFKLKFPDGSEGWMRGHVIGLQGDLSAYGYGSVAEVQHAYELARDMSVTAPAKPEKVEKAEKPANALAAAAKDKKAEEPDNALAAAAQDKAAQAPAAKDGEAATKASEVSKPGAAAKASGAADSPAKVAKVQKPGGPPTMICKMKAAANTRMGPSTVGFDRGFTIPRNATATILEVQVENRANRYRWFKVDYQGQQGWVREDLATYTGDTEALGLPWDLYPCPLGDNRNWVRGYNMPPNFDDSTWEHWGWDHGAPTGDPITTGPYGGLCVESFDCSKCGPGGLSTLQRGLSLGDSSVYSDAGWGFGYGHYVVVQYDHDILPESTQQALAQRGFPGGTIFVMYAHLHERKVQAGQKLEPGQVIATCGNSGNSEATHLHLELRAAKTAQYTRWANYRDGLMDPVILFQR